MPAEVRDLTGTVVAITGASSGIGAASARLLVESGARVVLGARRPDRLEQLVDELGADNATAVVMDVRRPEDATRLVDEGVGRFGRLDSLVANAGIGAYGGILDLSDEQLTVMMDTNIAGTVWPIRAAVRQFAAAGQGGDVVVVASVAGLRGGANEAVYASTKFAQVGLAGVQRHPHAQRASLGPAFSGERALRRDRGGKGISGATTVLLRAAVAAMLNAAYELDYPYQRFGSDGLIAQVNAAIASGDRDTILALASRLDIANNLGCPLN